MTVENQGPVFEKFSPIRIAIIGAGPSGLVCAKEALEAFPNAQIIILERGATLGGVFASSYQGLKLVNNQYLIAFSDFPPNALADNLQMWPADKYIEYLVAYSKNFNVDKCIKFGANVVQAKRTNGEWSISYDFNGHLKTESFDYLIICSGINSNRKKASIPGVESFSGEVIYSDDVADPSVFFGKRVVLIGLGETGSDLAYAASLNAKQIAVSVRRWPPYFIPRYHDGKPTDLDTSLLYHSLPRGLEQSPLSWMMRLKLKIERNLISSKEDKKIQCTMDELNHRFKGSKNIGPFRRITTKSEGFIKAYIKDPEILYPGIQSIKGSVVTFDNGQTFFADTIVVCAGHTFDVNFLPNSIARDFSSSNLYKYMFPLNNAGVCFVGFVRPGVGSIPPIAELQARYLMRILKNEIALPSMQQQQDEVHQMCTLFSEQFPLDRQRIPHLVDFYIYTTNIAEAVGVMPSQMKLLLKNPMLWYKTNASFMCPAIFRLDGPGAKPDIAIPLILSLPTMPLIVIFIEFLIHMACKLLRFIGAGSGLRSSQHSK